MLSLKTGMDRWFFSGKNLLVSCGFPNMKKDTLDLLQCGLPHFRGTVVSIGEAVFLGKAGQCPCPQSLL